MNPMKEIMAMCHSEYAHELITPSSLLTARILQTDACYLKAREQLPPCLISNLKWATISTFLPVTSQSVKTWGVMLESSSTDVIERKAALLATESGFRYTVCMFNSAYTAVFSWRCSSETVEVHTAFLVWRTAFNNVFTAAQKHWCCRPKKCRWNYNFN